MEHQSIPKHQRQHKNDPSAEDWQQQLGATPIAWTLDRNDAEKDANARLTNAQAEETEQKNIRRRISIGLSFTWKFALTFIVGFVLGNFFRISMW